MVEVVQADREELAARHAELLAAWGGAPFEEIERRADVGDLAGDEWARWDELEGIDFLLNGLRRRPR